ncbi:sugar phosphate isomerase/epimerase [Paenibacillus sp. YYML68]|uniref:sugar phosphate isomerase/epimerase family protein n=1 Tax=Paenibacillus sp. YYML68 TaxID=2909250 RepID=UPI002493BD1D|nr:sugar phosphate isomerase/epimerase family protein [Paenibacillus sp. YYML68]
MKFNLCTISFRHDLVSFRDLIHYAHEAGFSGIELWAVHARALVNYAPDVFSQLMKEAQMLNLTISMISDYLDLMTSDSKYEAQLVKFNQLIHMAHAFGTNKIRIFAGHKGSSEITSHEWEICTLRLRELAIRAHANDVLLVIETHPDTLADTLESTLALIHDVDHKQLRINLDYLHLWESGTAPFDAFRALRSWVEIVHLKNVTSRERLTVFNSSNVFSPNGSRDGMVSLAEGIIDYKEIMKFSMIDGGSLSASLEWFGHSPFQVLKQDMDWLKQIHESDMNVNQYLRKEALLNE